MFQLYQEVLQLDYKESLMLDSVEWLDGKGDGGDRLFYFLYKLFIGKQPLEQHDFLTWNEL